MSAFFDMLYAYRNVVYVRVKTDWLSVRIVRDGKRIGEYEDVPQIAIRQRKAFLYNVVAIGRDAAQAVRESGDVSL
jgi:hypothetical protein